MIPGPGRAALERWRSTAFAAHRPPAVATPRVMNVVSGGLFIGAGLLALAESLGGVDGGATIDHGRTADIRVAGLTAVLSGLLVFAAHDRLRRWHYHLTVGWGTVLITGAVWFAGGTPSAVVFATLYCVIAIGSSFFFSRPAALVHLALVIAGGLWAFAGTRLAIADRIVVLGTVVLVAASVGWLVRMTDAAETDALTGLPNRRGFDRALQAAVSRAAHDHRPLAVALLDLDHFKELNDSAGRTRGDRLLQVTTHAWGGELSSSAVLARYGGDEFALLLPEHTVEQATAVVHRLRGCLSAGTCSAGIAGAAAGDSGSMLTSRADAALYEAKRTGRDRVVHADRIEPEPIVDELRRALDHNELFVVYQPVVSLEAAAVVGVEALVRWQHPTRGVLGPDAFIPAAEASDLIHDLGRWVTEQAARQGARWCRRRGFTPNIGVNAAGPELVSPGYAERLLGLLADAGLPPEQFVLEVTETTLDADSCVVTATLAELRTHGVKVAIDDFGTGWSSLSRLDRLPVDILKIDRSFVEPLDSPGAHTALLAAVVALGTALNLDIVAEGVETPGQAAIIRRLGCAFVQGYLYSRPQKITDDEVPVIAVDLDHDVPGPGEPAPAPGPTRPDTSSTLDSALLTVRR